MELIELYDIAKKENLAIHRINLNSLNGLYIENNIFLNKDLKNECTEKEVLAEELGHHFSGVLPSLPFSTDYYNKLIRSKNEFKASKWMIYNLIPFDTLKSFLSQNMNKFDIAEELGVTIDFIDKAYQLYEPNFKEII